MAWSNVALSPPRQRAPRCALSKAAAASGVFRVLKGGHRLAWVPMYYWTDEKIRVHAFTSMVGLSLLLQVHQRAATAWSGRTMEDLEQQLGRIQQFELLHSRLEANGSHRVETVSSKQTLVQQARVQALDLEELIGNLCKPRGSTVRRIPKYCGINPLPAHQRRSQ